MIPTYPYEIKEFHGGITDNPVDNDPHKYETADNFLVTVNRKLFTRPGSAIWDDSNPQIPAGSQRIGLLTEHFDGTVLVQSAKKIYYVSGAFQTLLGPTGNDALPSADTTSVPVVAKWNNHLFISSSDYDPIIKIYRDDVAALQMRSAGLPALATAPVGAGTAGAENFLYAFHYFYEYKIGTVTFQDLGPVRQISVPNVDPPDTNSITLSSIPVIVNGSLLNYDTAVIKVQIYRTLNGGDTFWFVDEVTNGATSYIDTKADTTIATSTNLYTTGDVLDNGAPPLAKVIHVADSYMWYGNIKTSTGEILANRVFQSKASDMDSVPGDNYVDVEDDVVAISSFGLTPIILCANSIYRLDGRFDNIGGGILTHQKIDNRVGCIGPLSVVQVPAGICWAGQDGFYFSDGFKVIKLSEEFNDTFAEFVQNDTQKRRVYAEYDHEFDRVWWAVQSGTGGLDDVDKIFICDLRWGVKSDACFTSASNGDSFAPTAILYKDKQIIRGDRRGYIFLHADESLSDPLIDETKIPANWDKKTIIWDFKSIHTSFGNTIERKFVPRVLITAQNKTNLSIQLKANDDVNKRTVLLTPIRFRKNLLWGDPILVWGEDELIWNYDGIIEEQRRMTAGALRCSYKQLQITNAYVVIVGSDDMTTATVTASSSQVLIDDIVNYDWPTNIIGHDIYFEFDNYTKAFPILLRGDDTLTVLDPGGALQDGSHKWEIQGYPKDENLNLLAYNIHFGMFGKTQQAFRPDTTGENA